MGICHSQKPQTNSNKQESQVQSRIEIVGNLQSSPIEPSQQFKETKTPLRSQTVSKHSASLQLKSKKKLTVQPSPIRPIKRQISICQVPLSSHYSVMKSNSLRKQQSTTSLVQHNVSGQLRRLTMIQKDQDQQEYIDWLVGAQLTHPHITSIVEILTDKKQFYVIDDVCQDDSLMTIFKKGKIDEHLVSSLLNQMLNVLIFAKNKNLTHNRLTLNSFTLTNSTLEFFVKLIDYRNFYIKDKVSISNLYFLAPEVVMDPKTENSSSDCWSLGIIMYYLLTGTFPYSVEEGLTGNDLKKQIIKQSHNIDLAQIAESHSKGCVELLSMLLSKDRPSLEEVFAHPFVQECEKHIMKYSRTLYNLRKAKPQTYLGQCIMVYMVDRYQPEIKYQIEKLFDSIAIKRKGTITQQELYKFYQEASQNSQKDCKEIVEGIFKNLDTDKNGWLSLSEFLIGTIDRKQLLSDHNIQETFNQLSQNGIITLKSLRKSIEVDNNLIQQELEGIKKLDLKCLKQMLSEV